MQDRIVDRADLKLDPARVREGLAQRDLVPGEARPAHIDREGAVGDPLHLDEAGPVSRTRRPLSAGRAMAGRRTSRRRRSGCRCRRRPIPSRRCCRCAGTRRCRAHGIVQHHELVEGECGRPRWRAPPRAAPRMGVPRRSSTTIALPAPCIFRNRLWASPLMGVGILPVGDPPAGGARTGPVWGPLYRKRRAAHEGRRRGAELPAGQGFGGTIPCGPADPAWPIRRAARPSGTSGGWHLASRPFRHYVPGPGKARNSTGPTPPPDHEPERTLTRLRSTLLAGLFAMASGPVPGLVAGAAQAQQPSPPANAPPPASTAPPPAVTSPLRPRPRRTPQNPGPGHRRRLPRRRR